tara:strand:+ start:858 stop:1049 length:192 start_codon:yes stop_codon:yes gene_type:complete
VIESDKVVIMIQDAMRKRLRKPKASVGSNSDYNSPSNKQIPFAKFYKKKLMEKLNRERNKNSP